MGFLRTNFQIICRADYSLGIYPDGIAPKDIIFNISEGESLQLRGIYDEKKSFYVMDLYGSMSQSYIPFIDGSYGIGTTKWNGRSFTNRIDNGGNYWAFLRVKTKENSGKNLFFQVYSESLFNKGYYNEYKAFNAYALQNIHFGVLPKEYLKIDGEVGYGIFWFSNFLDQYGFSNVMIEEIRDGCIGMKTKGEWSPACSENNAFLGRERELLINKPVGVGSLNSKTGLYPDYICEDVVETEYEIGIFCSWDKNNQCVENKNSAYCENEQVDVYRNIGSDYASGNGGQMVEFCGIENRVTLQGKSYSISVHGKAYCEGGWWVDPCNWKSNCDTEEDWQFDDKEYYTGCDAQCLDPSVGNQNVEKNIGSDVGSGTNNVVSFCGVEDGVSKHGKAYCEGSWWVDPCNWDSNCDTGWKYDSGDYTLNSCVADCQVEQAQVSDCDSQDFKNIGSVTSTGCNSEIEFCGLFNENPTRQDVRER